MADLYWIVLLYLNWEEIAILLYWHKKPASRVAGLQEAG